MHPEGSSTTSQQAPPKDLDITKADKGAMKRNREAAMGPTTPRGSEVDETKVIGGLTPLAKKGRVQPGPNADKGDDLPTEEVADGNDQEPEDENSKSTSENRTSPAVGSTNSPSRPSAATDPISAPATPASKSVPRVPATEGKETKAIRQGVEALEWQDATTKSKNEEKSAEIAQVAAEVGESAQLVDQQDVEIAQVAAEVADSAQIVVEEEETAVREEIQETAETAAQVAETAEKLDQTPENARVEGKPLPKPPAGNSFSAFSSAASPFAALKSTNSPFAAVPEKPTPPASAADSQEQKPKAKTSFSVPAATSSVRSPSSAAIPTENSSHPPETPKAAAAPLASTSSHTTAALPSTPFGKSSGFGSTSAASPFAAFSGTSAFASAAKTPGTTATNSGGTGFGSYSGASPFSTIKKTAGKVTAEESDDVTSGATTGVSETDSGRKIGEPEAEDENKRIFTEQEIVTGEESDDVIHSVRCKLYTMVNDSWVERGTGLIKLNAMKDSDKQGARLVMRADATHRLLLNATLFSKFSMEVSQEKFVRFAIIEGTEPISYMLRMGGAAQAKTLVDAVMTRVATL